MFARKENFKKPIWLKSFTPIKVIFFGPMQFFPFFENCYIHHFEATSCQLIRGDPSG